MCASPGKLPSESGQQFQSALLSISRQLNQINLKQGLGRVALVTWFRIFRECPFNAKLSKSAPKQQLLADDGLHCH